MKVEVLQEFVFLSLCLCAVKNTVGRQIGFFLGLMYRRQDQKHQIWSLPGIGIGQSLLMDMNSVAKRFT